MVDLSQLVKEYSELENKIEEQLQQLPSYGQDCNCVDQIDTIKLIFTGKWDEIHEYCLKCGGYVENSELL
jgi:hypothetical protein